MVIFILFLNLGLIIEIIIKLVLKIEIIPESTVLGWVLLLCHCLLILMMEEHATELQKRESKSLHKLFSLKKQNEGEGRGRKGRKPV